MRSLLNKGDILGIIAGIIALLVLIAGAVLIASVFTDSAKTGSVMIGGLAGVA